MISERLMSSLPEYLSQNKSVSEACRKGFCRVWTSITINEIERLISEQNLPIKCEAREAEISPGLTHTFIRIIIRDEKNLLYDGVGVENYPPYFGSEETAPPHLRNSKPDMLNFYRRIEKTRRD
ncbi:MAG: hypothetical protein ACOZBZ_03435 [Patescibacteria group bacterium]